MGVVDLESVYLKYRLKIKWHIQKKMVKDQEEVDDIIQEVYLLAHKYKDRKFEREQQALSYLYLCAGSIIINFYRRRGIREEVILEVEDRDPGYTKLEQDMLYREMKRHMDQVPKKHREAFRLRYMEGLSYGEVAKRIGIPEGTVKARIYKAHVWVRENSYLLQEWVELRRSTIGRQIAQLKYRP